MYLSARRKATAKNWCAQPRSWQPAASLKDEGCVAYDLFESATRSDVLMICETWSNAKALAAHEQASHFTTLVPRLEQLGELKIEKFVF